MVDRSDWACQGDPIECDFEASAGHFEIRFGQAVAMLDKVLGACVDDFDTRRAARQFVRLARIQRTLPISHRTRYVGQIWEEDGDGHWRDIPDEVKGRTEWVHQHQAQYFRDQLSDALKTLHPNGKPPVTRIVKRTVTEELVIT
jgi:hypothetical protein